MFKRILKKTSKLFLKNLSIDNVLSLLDLIDNIVLDNIKLINPMLASKIENKIVNKLIEIRNRIDKSIKEIKDIS